jgi:hypothetical protein
MINLTEQFLVHLDQSTKGPGELLPSLGIRRKIFEISANQSILLTLAAMLNIRLERKTVTL